MDDFLQTFKIPALKPSHAFESIVHFWGVMLQIVLGVLTFFNIWIRFGIFPRN